MKIKKGDLVKVIAGGEKAKNKVGRVLEVFPQRQRVKIEGVALIKRHIKPQKNMQHREGGIIEDFGTVHLSNVMLMSETLERPVRSGAMFLADGKKIRVIRGRNLKPETI